MRPILLLLLALLSFPSFAGFNVQGLWWRSTESGWGLNISHQGNVLFASWFTYEPEGGLWLFMPSVAETSPNTYTGRIYRTTGPAFDSATWNSSAVHTTDVGSVTLTFTDENNGSFTYNVGGVTRTKPITRQVFGTPPTCTLGGSPGNQPVFQDTWWADPGGSESGWGVNVTHQGDIVFATWFTYGADGKGMWLFTPRADRVGASNTFTGDVYRASGPSFAVDTWDASQVVTTKVGVATLAFSDADHGTFSYTVGNTPGVKRITRLVYASPATVCRSADRRNGTYKLLATNFAEYLLDIDFDAQRFAIRSTDGASVSAGAFSGPVEGTYTFDNGAHFRTAENLVVGAHPLGTGTPVAFIAANRFVTSPVDMPETNFWHFSSDVQPASTPVVNSRIQAIRLAGSLITYCSVAPPGGLTRVDNCLAANLSQNSLTYNANGSVTWLDNGVPVNFYIMRSGSELLVVRSQAYVGTTGNKRFQLALQDSKTRAVGTYEGGASDGSWGPITIGATTFTRLGTTSGNSFSGTLSMFPTSAPLRALTGSDGVNYFVLGTDVLGAYIAARGSTRAGTIGFGLLR